MKITKIEKKKRLYLLELDGSEKLYITEDTIVRFMLSKGMEITEQELSEIQDYAQFSYGKNLALYHLSFKQRTAKEVKDYLTQHDIQPEIISQKKIIGLMIESMLILLSNPIFSLVTKALLFSSKSSVKKGFLAQS